MEGTSKATQSYPGHLPLSQGAPAWPAWPQLVFTDPPREPGSKSLEGSPAWRDPPQAAPGARVAELKEWLLSPWIRGITLGCQLGSDHSRNPVERKGKNTEPPELFQAVFDP